VTVLPDTTQQEERRGRKSTNSSRPKLPKRTSSMRKAYNYFFAATPQQPPSPTSPVVSEAVAQAIGSYPRDDDESAHNVGVDTPPRTPAREVSHAAADNTSAEDGK